MFTFNPVQEDLIHLRSTEGDLPVRPALVASLRELTAADVRSHPPFAFAPIIVMSNLERHRLNKTQVEAFAKTYGLLLVVWRLPLTGRYADSFDEGTLAQLYENEPRLLGLLCQRGPSNAAAKNPSHKVLGKWGNGLPTFAPVCRRHA